MNLKTAVSSSDGTAVLFYFPAAGQLNYPAASQVGKFAFMEIVQQLYARGKLLLTGEYAVLDGATALAVPTRLGQSLELVRASLPYAGLRWRALDHRGDTWVDELLPVRLWGGGPAGEPTSARSRLLQLLAAAEAIEPSCTHRLYGMDIITRLEFDRAWGLGTSSTLVSNFARLLEIDPYTLLEHTFGGSGYDIACATADAPLLYSRTPTGHTDVTEMPNWGPAWALRSHFVYRNRKQDSRAGMHAYRTALRRRRDQGAEEPEIDLRIEISVLTARLINSAAPASAPPLELLREHERLLSELLDVPPIQKELFPDFPGAVKSLGAWGGDFCWAISAEPAERVRTYFNERGFPTVLRWQDLVL